MLIRIEEDPDYLNRVIMVNESLVHNHNPWIRWESSHWKRKIEMRQEKVHQQKSAGEVLMIIFFNCHRPTYRHTVPPKMTINAEYYRTVLQQLLCHICQKRPHVKKQWILHHDNAQPQVICLVQAWLTRHNIEVMLHPLCSPDSAPCDFWLLPQLNKEFSRRFLLDWCHQCYPRGWICKNNYRKMGRTYAAICGRGWPLLRKRSFTFWFGIRVYFTLISNIVFWIFKILTGVYWTTVSRIAVHNDSFIFTNKMQRINCGKEANSEYSFKWLANESL